MLKRSPAVFGNSNKMQEMIKRKEKGENEVWLNEREPPSTSSLATRFSTLINIVHTKHMLCA
jgi:hypothetical protein